MNTKNIISIILVSVLATFAGITMAENWVGPTGTAPNNNVSAPINTSTSTQTKDGSIGVKNLLVGTDILLQGNASGSSKVGIGTTSPSAKLDVNGNLKVTAPGSMWIAGKTGTGGITSSTQLTTSGYHSLIRQKTSSGHVINLGGLGDDFGFFGYDKDRLANGYDFNMTIDMGTKRVGIGTTSPTKKLDVLGDINFSGDLYKSGVLLDFGGKFVDGTNIADAVYIDGNVGIGTTSPTAKLDVNGNISFSGDLYKNGSLFKGGKFVDGTSTADAVYTDGKVGIGTTSPTAKLDVSGDIKGQYIFSDNPSSDWSASAFFQYSDGRTFIGAGHPNGGKGNLNLYNYGGGNLTYLNIYSDKSYFSGNVGIGTTSPSQKLDVIGDIQSTGWIRTKGSNGLYFQDHGGGWNMSDNTWIRSFGNKDVYINKMLRADGGFQVDGRTMINGDGYWHTAQSTVNNHYGIFEGRRDDGKRGFYLGYGNGSSTVDLHLDNASRLDITGGNVYMSNNVGIGTTSPGEKLQVNGNVKADSFVYNSDRRLKKNIKKLENYRDILKINAVRFNWKKDGKADVGIIAQEVQKYFPEFVKKDDKGILAVDYPKLAVPMINLLQEQDKKIKEQEKRLNDLERRLEKLEK